MPPSDALDVVDPDETIGAVDFAGIVSEPIAMLVASALGLVGAIEGVDVGHQPQSHLLKKRPNGPQAVLDSSALSEAHGRATMSRKLPSIGLRRLDVGLTHSL